jgi:hypothetical protein
LVTVLSRRSPPLKPPELLDYSLGVVDCPQPDTTEGINSGVWVCVMAVFVVWAAELAVVVPSQVKQRSAMVTEASQLVYVHIGFLSSYLAPSSSLSQPSQQFQIPSLLFPVVTQIC